MKKSIFRSTAATTIAVAGLAMCYYAHASKFTVTSSSSGSGARFIVTRDDTTAAETVNYRTVSLSAYAGQHYTAKSGMLTFPAGQSAVTNTVTETSPTVDAYNFQAEAWREYSFVLTDEGGFPLAIGYRNFITGTQVKSDDAFGEKRVSINAGRITVKDGGYDQAYYDVPIDSYYSAAAPKKYLVATGAQLRMTLNFLAREKDDGYQYVAIYANTSTSNVDTGAKDGDPGNVSSSRYMAGFTIDGNVSSTYYPYVFPLTSKDTACGEQAHPWSNNSNGNLKQQYFKTNCRATDGRLIIPTDLSSLYVRFNASGNLDDDWYASNVVARIQAVDTTAPTSLLGVSVPPGTYAKGNEVYVSVAFGEIMKASGSPTISTTWGSFAYVNGSGSNVLTFKGTISTSASNTLDVVKMQHGGNMQGKVQDLAGNEFSGSVSARNLATLAANHNYSITYNLSGGTLPSGTSNPATYTYETPSFTLATPTRPGYIFTGWTGSNGARPQTSITIEANSHGDCAYTANWRRIIPYIDADGNEQLCAEYGTLASGQGNAEYDWDELYFFVVDDNVTFRGQNRFNRNGITKIIICDGASLAVSNANDTAMIANTLAFYGQTNGTGRLNLNSSVRGLSADTDIQINGVNVTANGGEYGIYATGSVTINGGNVNATGGTEGIYAGNVINLGWTRPTDSIVANSYGGRVIVKGGQVFTDGSNIYHGELSSAERDAIAGKTLRPAYSITLPEGVVASGVVTQIVNTAYARPGDTVTLSAATPGYAIGNVTVNGNAIDPVGGIYTFAADAASITVTATVGVPIPYIDEDGTERICTDYTVLTNATGDVAYGEWDAESWYVVTNNVTISGQLYFNDVTAHLILCDGATLAVTNANGAAIDACGLTIYGQTNGTGTVTASGGDSGIYAENGSVTINGGTVTANGGDIGIYAAYHGSVTINGGTVTANGGNYGIVAANSIYDDTPQGTIILGWTNPTDSITANSYLGNVSVKSNQRFTDGSNIYGGRSFDPSDLAGKTLRPAYSITLPEGVVASGVGVVRQDGTTAYVIAGTNVTLSAATPGYVIVTVTVNGNAIDPVDGVYSFTASAASITVTATVFVVSSVIEIGTGAEFAEYMASRLVSYSDITFAFTNDIDMSGVTYTRPSGDFNATLDGRGHTLTSLSLKKDMPNLIGTLKGTVRDLTIAGYSSPGNVGGTSLIAYSSSGGTLSGVVLTNCTWNLPNATPGTAGFIYETQDNMTTITNCWLVDCRVIGIDATLGDQVIGGFVAKASQLKMVDCHVVFSNTNIISIGNGIPAAGAFIGQTAAGVTIERCTSNARVKTASNVATQVGGAGGFVGVATMSGSPVIRDCANFGIVESTVPAYSAGGFIGEVGSESGDFSLTVQSCFNYGDVASPVAAGGLIGRYRGATSTLSNNGNSGAISSEAGFAGGLVGLVCYNGANRTWRILNAMQAGAVSTMSGCAGLLVGGVEESDLGGLTMSVSNAWIAGFATYSDGGQAGILFGGRDITAENELTIELHASKVLESNGTLALYYDKGNAAVAWDSPVTFGADALSGSAVRNALNLYAREQNYTTWVRGRCFPELMTFGVECFSGFFIKFR